MLNYSEGAQHCKLNSARLETSARIILKDEDGTDSFGLLLYYLSYEEIAKAIFCLFVDRKWVTEDFVDYVFKYHEAKIFLFEEIFRSLEIINGKGHLGGAPIGDVLLENFIELHKRVIKEHRRKTMDFVYVGKNNDWKVPSFSLSNIKEIGKKKSYIKYGHLTPFLNL